MQDPLKNGNVLADGRRVMVQNPKDATACRALLNETIARICVGRSGDRMRTATYLRLRADHSVAMDAVWTEVDETIIDALGFYKMQTLVRNKEEYVTRPDLGRQFSKETLDALVKDCVFQPDVQVVVADGLSAFAIQENLRDVYAVLRDGLEAQQYRLGTPVFVRYGRVATMDPISEVLHARVTVLLVGERPGLAVGSSMGCYMAYESSSAKPESQRTVISNIHRNGTPPVEAGAQIVDLVGTLMREKKSGVALRG